MDVLKVTFDCARARAAKGIARKMEARMFNVVRMSRLKRRCSA